MVITNPCQWIVLACPALLSLATLVSAQTMSEECFTSTFEIFQAMELQNPFVEETYIICPNTIIDIGFLDDNNGCCVNGDYPLYVRSRSTVKCGEDGKASNNCVLRGGNSQLLATNSLFQENLLQGVRVMGITFEAAEFVSAALAARGDITFVDCVWRVSGIMRGKLKDEYGLKINISLSHRIIKQQQLFF